MRRPLRSVAIAATVALSLLAETAVVPSAGLAAAAADPLPRAYQVDALDEVPDLQFYAGPLALSADGNTALHLSTNDVLVASPTGEVVGLGLDGQPLSQVVDAAISADGRKVAFVARGADAAELGLPPEADPGTREAIFVRDRLLDATTWVPVPDADAGLRLGDLAMSEDGARLAVGLRTPPGVLLATLSDAAPAVRVVGLAGSQTRGTALSGDGKVLAVHVRRDDEPVLLRFDAASGERLPGERPLTSAQAAAWSPHLDRAGRRTAFSGLGEGVVVADLAGGADVTLDASATAPYASGDLPFDVGDLPTAARLSADGGTVAFLRSGALWTQAAQAGRAPVLASPGLDGRIADSLPGETVLFPDAVHSFDIDATGSALAFLSASSAFVAPRTDEPQPSRLYKAVPSDTPPPAWPEDAELTATPGTTSVAASWPAAGATAATYDVSVDGARVTTVTTTQTVLSDLTPGATVEIAVVARDSAGRASAPLTRSVTLREDLPPGEAPLSALAGPGARVRLQWERTDATGYRVLRDGVKLADVGADVTSYEDTKVAADTGYTYTVAALRAGGEAPYTRAAQVRVDKLAVTEAAASLPRVGGWVALGREATFALVGAAGFTGTADLVVRTAADPARKVTVALPETAAGRYQGGWTPPEGTVEVVSATLRLADGVGTAIERPVAGLPAQVSGLVKVAATVPGGDGDGMRLQVWSESADTGSVTTFTESGTVAVPVVPAADHKVTTRRSDGLDGTTPRTVAVASGQVVDVAVAPHAAASLMVTVGWPDVLVVLDTRTGPRSGRTGADGRVGFGTLDAATEVTVKAKLSAQLRATRGLAAVPDRSLTLEPGGNALSLTPEALPKVTVRGTTEDAEGRALRGMVTVRQMIDGYGLSQRVEAAADGTWSAEVFGGTPTVAVATHAGRVSPEAEVDPDGPVRLVFPLLTNAVVRPKLTTITLEGQRVEQRLDPVSAGYYQPYITAGGRRIFAVSPETPLDLPVGSKVTFCADGGAVGLTRACAETVTGDSPDVPLSVEIRERGRVVGRVLDPSGAPRTGRGCALLENAAEPVRAYFSGSALKISAAVPGTYVLTVTACGTNDTPLSVRRQVTINEGRVLDVGDLRLSPAAGLLEGSGSGFRAVRQHVPEGETAHLRGQIEFTDRTKAGSARLEFPPGVTVPENGVLRDGRPVEFSRVDGAVVIPLPAAPTRTLDVYARTSGTARFTLSVTSGETTELLGSAQVQVDTITLEVPESSRTGRFTATGEAPAGADVVVRDGDKVIATAEADEGGRWQAAIDLGTAGHDVSRHVLRAGAQTATVVVDPHASVVEEVTMSQEGTTRVFHPVDGVANFPWIHYPYREITIRARFTGPVAQPRARLGTLDLALAPVLGEDHVYAAKILPKATEVGDLSITYAPVQDRPLLPVPPAPVSTALFDPADAAVEDPVTTGDTVSQRFTVPVPRLGPDAQLRYRLTVQPLPGYRPDAAGEAAVRASGVKVYQAETTDEGASAIVDLATLAARTKGTELGKALSAAGFLTGPARFGFEILFVSVSTGDNMYSLAEAPGKYDEINRMLEMAAQCRDGAQGEIYKNAAERLKRRAIQLDVYQVTSTGGTMVFAPATFGLSMGLWAVTWAIGKGLEIPLMNDIDALRRQMNSDETCDWPPSARPWTRVSRPKAVIGYRFDPSGFVYEGLTDRRISGVTATLLHAPTEDGPWQPWDAAVYGDLNPQITNAEGRYGWDVPEGWWKVIYTKDGYLPAESRVLKVLPPHTDVDVSMLRADLAAVSQVQADATGLTVTFTQPVRSAQALSGALRVTTSDGRPVGGQWSTASPSDDRLALAFRFTGENRSGEVTVTVDPLLQDHGGRALAAGVERRLPVEWAGPDSAAPQVSVTGVTDGAVYRVRAVPAAGCATVDQGSGVATPATLTLTGPTGVGAVTATCAGAVDRAGNAAPPVSATYTVAYVFTGFAAPVRNDVVNTAKAGQGIAIKWWLTDAFGAPVNDLRTADLTVTPLNCQTGLPTGGEPVPAEGAEPLQILGAGAYQVMWRTPRSYLDTCLTLHLDIGEGGMTHTARFRFTRSDAL
ncbi:hypothetical protein FDA94_13770 [Herbidospora galbida]|uniref:Fibronectin type-III domain-containing protein n=1 Tax=Herbidospora galbida TaxID=2575442 RepID=A0A4U3MKC8_9ACTN|nr:PxKF domain-containing protein [Herbidospora galbida]TKK88366.1 hypothetical protein FDA94_13770 [Herbidospora galbida]